MNTENLSGELWFGAVRVCSVDAIFASDGTFYGRATLAVDAGKSELHSRLLDFVDLGVRVNRRIEENGSVALEVDAFATYGDLVGSGKWVAMIGGIESSIDGAPVFYGEDEVSWVCLAIDPS